MDKKEKTQLRIEVGKILDEKCHGCIQKSKSNFCRIRCPYGHRIAEIGDLIDQKTVKPTPKIEKPVVIEEPITKGGNTVAKKSKVDREQYEEWKAQGLKKSAIASRFGVSANSLTYHIKKWEKEDAWEALPADANATLPVSLDVEVPTPSVKPLTTDEMIAYLTKDSPGPPITIHHQADYPSREIVETLEEGLIFPEENEPEKIRFWNLAGKFCEFGIFGFIVTLLTLSIFYINTPMTYETAIWMIAVSYSCSLLYTIIFPIILRVRFYLKKE